MSDTASIRLPRTGSIRTGAVSTRAPRATSVRASRERIRAARAPRSPRQAYAAGTYVIVDAEYAARTPGTFTGVETSARADGTFTSTDASSAGRAAGSYVD